MGKPAVDKAVAVGGSFKIPSAYEGIQRAFVTWVDRGYYAKDAMSYNYEESNMLFFQQKSPLYPQGNWVVPNLIENVLDPGFFEVSSFLWPPTKKGQKSNNTSWCGGMYIINADTKYAQEAINYLDHVYGTEESTRLWYEVANRIMPYKKPISNLKVHPLQKETIENILSGKIDLTPAHNTMSPPEAGTWMTEGIGKTFIKEITPKEFVDQLDRLWQEGRKEGLTKDTIKLE
jgi:ABC-type glycerol-3-phosphate transport system substrate-binding protein